MANTQTYAQVLTDAIQIGKRLVADIDIKYNHSPIAISSSAELYDKLQVLEKRVSEWHVNQGPLALLDHDTDPEAHTNIHASIDTHSQDERAHEQLWEIFEAHLQKTEQHQEIILELDSVANWLEEHIADVAAHANLVSIAEDAIETYQHYLYLKDDLGWSKRPSPVRYTHPPDEPEPDRYGDRNLSFGFSIGQIGPTLKLQDVASDYQSLTPPRSAYRCSQRVVELDTSALTADDIIVEFITFVDGKFALVIVANKVQNKLRYGWLTHMYGSGGTVQKAIVLEDLCEWIEGYAIAFAAHKKNADCTLNMNFDCFLHGGTNKDGTITNGLISIHTEIADGESDLSNTVISRSTKTELPAQTNHNIVICGYLAEDVITPKIEVRIPDGTTHNKHHVFHVDQETAPDLTDDTRFTYVTLRIGQLPTPVLHDYTHRLQYSYYHQYIGFGDNLQLTIAEIPGNKISLMSHVEDIDSVVYDMVRTYSSLATSVESVGKNLGQMIIHIDDISGSGYPSGNSISYGQSCILVSPWYRNEANEVVFDATGIYMTGINRTSNANGEYYHYYFTAPGKYFDHYGFEGPKLRTLRPARILTEHIFKQGDLHGSYIEARNVIKIASSCKNKYTGSSYYHKIFDNGAFVLCDEVRESGTGETKTGLFLLGYSFRKV